MVNLITGTAFDAPKRMHHAEDEPALEFPSSATSRRRNLLALRAMMWGTAKKSGPTARDYVQNGLVAMWDGIENAGWGVHDSNSSVWKDLVGERDATLFGGEWSDVCLNIGNDYCTFTSTLFENGNNVTLEFIFTLDESAAQSWATPFTNRVDSYSFFRRDGRYWEVKVNNGGNRAKMSPFIGKSFFVRSSGSGHYIAYNDSPGQGYFGGDGFTSCNAEWYIGGTGDHHLGVGAKMYALRLYNRPLSNDEVAANYAIDKVRFGLT